MIIERTKNFSTLFYLKCVLKIKDWIIYELRGSMRNIFESNLQFGSENIIKLFENLRYIVNVLADYGHIIGFSEEFHFVELPPGVSLVFFDFCAHVQVRFLPRLQTPFSFRRHSLHHLRTYQGSVYGFEA